MDKQFFFQLLHKYNRNNVTAAEREFIEAFFNLFQEEPDILDIVDVNRKNQIKNEIKEKLFDKILNADGAALTLRLRRRRNMWVAAAAVIILIVAKSLFFSNNPSLAKEIPENVGVIHNANRIILLARRSNMVSGDGSGLTYPSSFNGKEKPEVYPESRAFFDIRQNIHNPFGVYTGNWQTLVPGTAFNSTAMLHGQEITVSMVRGTVKVTDRSIVPGISTPHLQIKYNQQQDNSEMKEIKDADYRDWKSSDLLLLM